MPWIYYSDFGILTAPTGTIAAIGYSGHGAGLDNPAYQNVPDVGPLPEGSYTIGPAVDTTHLGPGAMPLSPLPGTDLHGRDGFWVHQDNVQHNQSASEGCLVLSLDALKAMAASPDKTLTVRPDTALKVLPA